MRHVIAEMDLVHRVDYDRDPRCVHSSRSAAAVHTVLGCSVAVCLWDRDLEYGGINHFLQPRVDSRAEATPPYGNVATVTLVRIVLKAGCRSENLVAQVLGGGFPEGAQGPDIGAQNVAEATLGTERAPSNRTQDHAQETDYEF